MALLSEWNFGFVTLPSRPGSFTKRRGSGSRNLRRRGGKEIQFMSQPELVNPCKLEPGGEGLGIPGVILSFSQTDSPSRKLIIRIWSY